MRALVRLSAAAVLLAAVAGEVGAGPKPADGWSLVIEEHPGAIFAGLARDGDGLLVTNLADGRLYRRGADGAMTAFGPAFPHGIDVIGDPTGPYRVTPHGAGYLVAQGWTPADAGETPEDHALVAVGRDGTSRVIDATFWNPFDFLVDGETIYVVNSARNTIERLAAGGARTTIVTFLRLSESEAALQRLSPTEFVGEGRTYEFDAVPTGIALDEGRLFVALFGGFPFLAGSGRVVSLALSGDGLAVEVASLNAPVDLAFTADGSLLVAEHGLYDQGTGFVADSGRLLAIDRTTGDRRILLDGLTRPAAILTIDPGRIVVSELGGRLLFLTRTTAN